MIEQTACTGACTTDSPKALGHHELMKADLRISVKDYRRGRNLKIELAELSLGSSRQFFVRMNRVRWPADGRPVSNTRVLTALRKSIVKACRAGAKPRALAAEPDAG